MKDPWAVTALLLYFLGLTVVAFGTERNIQNGIEGEIFTVNIKVSHSLTPSSIHSTRLEDQYTRHYHHVHADSIEVKIEGLLNGLPIALSRNNKIETITLKLELHENLISESFQSTIVNADGSESLLSRGAEHCYYTGIVEDLEGSLVFLNSCGSTLEGQIHTDEGEVFIITGGDSINEEEDSNDNKCQHYLFKQEDLSIHQEVKYFENRNIAFNNIEKYLRGEIESNLGHRSILAQAKNENFFVKISLVLDSLITNIDVQSLSDALASIHGASSLFQVIPGLNKVQLVIESIRVADIRLLGGGAGTDYLYSASLWVNATMLPFTNSSDIILFSVFNPANATLNLAYYDSICTERAVGIFDNSNVLFAPFLVARDVANSLGMQNDVHFCFPTTNILSNENFVSSSWSNCTESILQSAILNLQNRYGGSLCILTPPTAKINGSYWCGNGLVDPGETCDCGLNTPCLLANNTVCSSLCQILPFCGNGILNEFEDCDCGTACASSQGCNTFCEQIPFCGDGIVEFGEECDCGNNCASDPYCVNCVVDGRCGDGILQPGEQCEPGFGGPGDNPLLCEKCMWTPLYCTNGTCCNVAENMIFPKGVVCESSLIYSTCLVSDICDGISTNCTPLSFLTDGSPCSFDDLVGTCWKGQCVGYDIQCYNSWGANGVFALHGNCSISNCGVLDCYLFGSGCQVEKQVYAESAAPFTQNVYSGQLIDDGTNCNSESQTQDVCVNQNCVSLASFNSDSTPCLDSNLHICNEKGRCITTGKKVATCLCDPGYTGIFCNEIVDCQINCAALNRRPCIAPGVCGSCFTGFYGGSHRFGNISNSIVIINHPCSFSYPALFNITSDITSNFSSPCLVEYLDNQSSWITEYPRKLLEGLFVGYSSASFNSSFNYDDVEVQTTSIQNANISILIHPGEVTIIKGFVMVPFSDYWSFQIISNVNFILSMNDTELYNNGPSSASSVFSFTTNPMNISSQVDFTIVVPSSPLLLPNLDFLWLDPEFKSFVSIPIDRFFYVPNYFSSYLTLNQTLYSTNLILSYSEAFQPVYMIMSSDYFTSQFSPTSLLLFGSNDSLTWDFLYSNSAFVLTTNASHNYFLFPTLIPEYSKFQVILRSSTSDVLKISDLQILTYENSIKKVDVFNIFRSGVCNIFAPLNYPSSVVFSWEIDLKSYFLQGIIDEVTFDAQKYISDIEFKLYNSFRLDFGETNPVINIALSSFSFSSMVCEARATFIAENDEALEKIDVVLNSEISSFGELGGLLIIPGSFSSSISFSKQSSSFDLNSEAGRRNIIIISCILPAMVIAIAIVLFYLRRRKQNYKVRHSSDLSDKGNTLVVDETDSDFDDEFPGRRKENPYLAASYTPSAPTYSDIYHLKDYQFKLDSPLIYRTSSTALEMMSSDTNTLMKNKVVINCHKLDGSINPFIEASAPPLTTLLPSMPPSLDINVISTAVDVIITDNNKNNKENVIVKSKNDEIIIERNEENKSSSKVKTLVSI